MKAILAGILMIGMATGARAQFYAPDTEYHDSVQRVFAVEATRVLAWLDGLRKVEQTAEVTHSLTTRPDQSSVWDLQCLDAEGKRIRGAKVEYGKESLESGPQFYRHIWGQLWRAKILNSPVRTASADEVLKGFWTGGEMAGAGREESLIAALRLVSTNFTLADAPARAGALGGLLVHAALPSTADRLTVDTVVLARAAVWLAFAEQVSSTKLDRLWAPILFLAGRDRTASALWQKEVPASSESKTASEKYWNLILRGSGTHHAYLYAAEQKHFAHGLSLMAYDVSVNGSGKLFGELLPDISRDAKTLFRAHNYGPLLALRTTIGGGHILNGAWPYFSRLAFLDLLEAFPASAADAALFKDALDKAKRETDALKKQEYSGDMSLIGLKEATPLLDLGHKEGAGKLRPAGVLSVRDALNYGWEMGGLQMGARKIFVHQRWGVKPEGLAILSAATEEIEGWMPFFVNSRQTQISTYQESLLRLQLIDGMYERVGFSANPHGKSLTPAEAVRLWIKRSWLRPREFEWQVRAMWDAEIKQEMPDLVLALHKEAGARGAVEVLQYYGQITKKDWKEVPRGDELRALLADALPQPTVLWLNAIYDRDFAKLEPYERGVELEKIFWRNPDSGLEARVLRAYLSHPAYNAAKKFYLSMRESLSEPVAFSNGPGDLLWMAGYITNDKELRQMAIEDSASGSYADMNINICEHALTGDEKKLALQVEELIERYESNQGENSYGRTLEGFLPMLTALKVPKHPQRAEALRYFGKAPVWTFLRWIWIEKYKIPTAEAITFLGGRENDHLRSLMIAVLEKDQPRALEMVNAFNAPRRTVDEYSLLSQHIYSKVHPLRPEPEWKSQKPAKVTFTPQAIRKKLGKNVE